MAKAPSLKALAAKIEKEWPDLVAIVYPARHPLGGFCCTDRKIPGTRLRHPGKGRRGSRLIVSWRPGHGPSCHGSNVHLFGVGRNTCSSCGWDRYRAILDHNAAETYRTNQDVVNWIASRKAGR
jgi:hypothetical protein